MLGQPHPDYSPLSRRRTVERYRHARQRLSSLRRRHFSLRTQLIIRLVSLLLLICCLVAAVGLVALDRSTRGYLVSNVTVRGFDVGQMRPDEARSALAQQYTDFLAAPVTFEYAGRTWQPPSEQLGLFLDIDEAVTRAYNLGHHGDLLSGFREGLAIWQAGFELPLRLRIDQAVLQAYLLELAAEVEVAPRDATLQIESGEVLSVSAQSGQQLLVDETMRDVLAAVQSLQPQTIALRTRMLHPTVEDTGIVAAHQQVLDLLQEPVTLTAGDQSWVLSPTELGTLVRLDRVPDPEGAGDQMTVTLDQRRLKGWVEYLARDFDTPPVEPRLSFTGSGLNIIREGRTGVQLDVAAAVTQLDQALWQHERTISLPVLELQPYARPETLASLGIVELVGQGKSSFLHSEAYRVTNIQAGARQMNGVLIPPGTEFSFNQTVGEIDETNGFTKGYAIVDGRTQIEWGGGVCQVSTTVFRAAFWSGIPITERNQHSFRISWYEKFEPIGMDAAIFTGPNGYDLRFINDTGNWLLIEAYADTVNEVLTVNFYGTDPGRQVIQTPPSITNRVPAPSQPRYVNDPKLPSGTVRQTDVARGGMDVRVGRIVKNANGTVLFEDTFFSRFEAWPNVFVRGTG